MFMVRRWPEADRPDGRPYPHYIATLQHYPLSVPGHVKQGEWNLYAINPYYIITLDFASCHCEAGEAGRGNLEPPKS